MTSKMPDFQASVNHLVPPEVWTLTLNRYQRDNLLWLLSELVGYGTEGVEPFTFAHNGDWVGEIAWMLGKKDSNASGPSVKVTSFIDEEDNPNQSADFIRTRVADWLKRIGRD